MPGLVPLTALLVCAVLPAPPMANVRSTNARLARAVREGYDRSPTFRRLVEALERTDVILYVEPGECQCGRAAACLSLVAGGGAVRYLRATITLRRVDAELVEQIGHELQHAIEIAAQSDLTTEERLAAFYRKRSTGCGPSSWCFETAAARVAGAAVRTEIYQPK